MAIDMLAFLLRGQHRQTEIEKEREREIIN